MGKVLNFIKMEGLGNDFILTDGISDEQIGGIRETFARLCDRKIGIGADGIIFILPSASCDFRMRIFNSDGSEAEMCGNGIRCFAKYLKIKGISQSDPVTIETLAGPVTVGQVDRDTFRVTMGKPVLKPELIPLNMEMVQESGAERFMMQPLEIDGKVFDISAVSMGNPHAVLYADALTDELVCGIGPAIECHELFPKKTNVEFIKVLSDREIQMRVYERGCGETSACGTGACAAVVSGIINGLHGKRVVVHLPGGDLLVAWDGNPDSGVYMTGPALVVFSGTVEL